jgi:hypothetical protein
MKMLEISEFESDSRDCRHVFAWHIALLSLHLRVNDLADFAASQPHPRR